MKTINSGIEAVAGLAPEAQTWETDGWPQCHARLYDEDGTEIAAADAETWTDVRERLDQD